MSVMLIFGLMLVVGSSLYLFYLNQQDQTDLPVTNAAPPVASSNPPPPPSPPVYSPPVSSPPVQAVDIQEEKGTNLGLVILINLLFYAVGAFNPVRSVHFFGFQILLNIIAACYCFYAGRPQLGRTIMLCLLWVCLIGPVILVSVGFVVLWAVCGNHHF